MKISTSFKKYCFRVGIPAVLLVFMSGISVSAQQEAPQGADLYAAEPVQLTVTQCGQCHPSIYQNIKQDGKRHRFHCLDCHEQLHAYSPKKNNYAAIMPQCSSCHTLPHGEAFASCLDCHKNPHTPLNVAIDEILAANCGKCHTGPNGQLTKFPSKHTEQGCDTCHSEKHGRIPSCMECHEPHLPGQEIAYCLSCHPVHKPLQIAYDGSAQWNSTCATCHDSVYEPWSKTPSKHGGVNCGECHTSHGFIPKCQMCHETPHDERLLAKFPNCLECHIDPHDLPVKGK